MDEYASMVTKSIRRNAKHLQSLYEMLSDFKYKIYNLHLRRKGFEIDWEEDLNFTSDFDKLKKEYKVCKWYVKIYEEHQRKRKALLKSYYKFLEKN